MNKEKYSGFLIFVGFLFSFVPITVAQTYYEEIPTIFEPSGRINYQKSRVTEDSWRKEVHQPCFNSWAPITVNQNEYTATEVAKIEVMGKMSEFLNGVTIDVNKTIENKQIVNSNTRWETRSQIPGIHFHPSKIHGPGVTVQGCVKKGAFTW